MNKPNHNFHLTVKELALIEIALIHYQTESSPDFDDKMVSGPRHKEVQELLAKFYHQKLWYRPKDEIYVSG